MATLTLDGNVRTATAKRYLFGPVVDFLMLGGASLILLPLVVLFLPSDTFQPVVLVTTLALAHVINHPHFAHSYQIFYRDFRSKLSSVEYPPALRRRYFLAGIMVPIGLIAYFVIGCASGDAALLGWTVNLMMFLVGWHYVKQGYGMLMMDAVLKRSFFTATEKNVLLINAYACWLTTWIYGNRIVKARDYFSLQYYTFEVPDPIFYLAAAVTIASTASVLLVFVLRCRRNEEGDVKGVPFNGAMAYLTSIYLWMMFVKANPLMLFIVPAFHSLQYMLIVWRYQLNLEAGRNDGRACPGGRPFGYLFKTLASYRLTLFALAGLGLGYFGFWWAPELLDSIVAYDKAVFGASLFLFMFWIFINVHHYFIDNVIWKSTNPEMRTYLFSP